MFGLIGYAILNGQTQSLEDDINEASVRVLNLVVAFSLPAKDAALFMAIWSPVSKLALFALHYATFQYIGRRNARLAGPQAA